MIHTWSAHCNQQQEEEGVWLGSGLWFGLVLGLLLGLVLGLSI